MCIYLLVGGRFIVVNGSLLSLHSKQEHTKQSFFFLLKELICFVCWVAGENQQPTYREKIYFLVEGFNRAPGIFFRFDLTVLTSVLHYRQCFFGGGLACVTGRFNFSWSRESRPHSYRRTFVGAGNTKWDWRNFQHL